MVQISHSGTNTEKLEEIILAAQKRFGAYGFEKTTMQEIAEDIGISKAAMYYYFSDKESLYKEVIEKERNIFTDTLRQRLKDSNHPAESIRIYVSIRTDFIRTLLNLNRMRLDDHKGLQNIMLELKKCFRANEIEKLTEILNQGISRKIFQVEDVEATTTLFLNGLIGLSKVFMNHRQINYFDDEQYMELKKQIMLFVEIFIKGISK